MYVGFRSARGSIKNKPPLMLSTIPLHPSLRSKILASHRERIPAAWRKIAMALWSSKVFPPDPWYVCRIGPYLSTRRTDLIRRTAPIETEVYGSVLCSEVRWKSLCYSGCHAGENRHPESFEIPGFRVAAAVATLPGKRLNFVVNHWANTSGLFHLAVSQSLNGHEARTPNRHSRN